MSSQHQQTSPPVNQPFNQSGETPALPPTHLVLVRHAETEANLIQVWQGDLDAPLTERGLQQVRATATRLAHMHQQEAFDVFYVSPLPRAMSTATAISEAMDLPMIVEDGLREFGLGDWEGRSLHELRDVENLWGRWDADPAFAPPNGESPISFNARAMQTTEAIAARHPGQRVLAVGHGAWISSVLATLLGEDAREWRRFDAPNCGISVLVREETGWRGVVVNDISHLPTDARVDYSMDY